MSGIVEINKLLIEMNPVLDETDYVFCTKKCLEINEEITKLNPISIFLETEGLTVIILKNKADEENLSYDAVFNKITLEIHSSLEAVGLTAAISKALTKYDISANVVAAYYHDHVFVPKDKAILALEVLKELRK